jgi:hypothetical protein
MTTHDAAASLTDHDRTQLDMCLKGCVSGCVCEWPHLREAIRKLLLSHDRLAALLATEQQKNAAGYEAIAMMTVKLDELRRELAREREVTLEVWDDTSAEYETE